MLTFASSTIHLDPIFSTGKEPFFVTVDFEKFFNISKLHTCVVLLIQKPMLGVNIVDKAIPPPLALDSDCPDSVRAGTA
jgi:hypothetical protein